MHANFVRALRRVLLLTAAACLLSISIAAHPGSGIAVDGSGQVYFLDTGSGLWRIDTKGVVTRLSRERNHWLAIDPNSGFATARLPTDPHRGLGHHSGGLEPDGAHLDRFPDRNRRDGSLYYKRQRPGDLQIMPTTPAGATSVFATLPASIAHFNGMTVVADGSIYFTDNSTISKVNAAGQIWTGTTIFPLTKPPSIPDTEKPYLRGLAIDPKGNMYVADSGDARLLKITPAGAITTLVQLESPGSTHRRRPLRRHRLCPGVPAHRGRRPPRLAAPHPKDHPHGPA